MKFEMINLLVAAKVREMAITLREKKVEATYPGRSVEDINRRARAAQEMSLDAFIPKAYEELVHTMNVMLTHINQQSTPGADTPSPPAAP